MSKEELLALIDEKVSKQGNQGATELGEVLVAIINYFDS